MSDKGGYYAQHEHHGCARAGFEMSEANRRKQFSKKPFECLHIFLFQGCRKVFLPTVLSFPTWSGPGKDWSAG